MIAHHPPDELLLAQAGGRLDAGAALLVGVHLEACATCRARVRQFEAIGGALLEAAEPVLMAPDSLGRVLARIDAGAMPAAKAPTPAAPLPLPEGMRWPAALAGCEVSRWRWMAPGMHFARVVVPHDRSARLFLLRIAAGRSLARHTHSGQELTQVLHGAFADERGTFACGDFDAADADVHHQPLVPPGGECICLASVARPLVFEERLAGLLGRLIGM